MYAARAEQAVIVPHEQVTFNLLESIKYYANKNEQGRTAEELSELRLNVQQSCEGRHTGNGSQEQRTGQRNAIHNPIYELCRFRLRTFDSGDACSG